ncbi:MAG: anti-sigma factor family protein [Solirubrobacteraceae bacterium]
MTSAAKQNVDRTGVGRRELAELSALADGTVAPACRHEVEARIAVSPELSALYERERRVVELLRDAGQGTQAPPMLRARIEAHRRRGRKARLRPAYVGALGVVLAVVVLALVLVSPGSTPGAPSVSQAAALAPRGSTAPPPPPDPSSPAVKLGRSIGQVYFPNWSSTLGWRAVGQRVDRLNARLALTVYYESHGRQIAYTVLAGRALAQPQGAVSYLARTELRTLTLNRRIVVSWRRAGHTCVLSGVGVAAGELQHLAAWKVRGV